MGDCVTIAIKDAGERSPLKPRVPVIRVSIWRNDGPVEDFAAGEVGVEVDVGGQDKVLVVILGTIAKCHQIGWRGDLVRVFSCSASPAIFGLGREADKANRDK